MNSRRAVFLDKDGTVIVNVPYNVDPDLIELMPGVAEGLHRLQQAGYRLVIITNQSGIAQGFFQEEALTDVARRMAALLHQYGVTLAGFYYCPHHPEGSVSSYRGQCECRKPRPGMLLQAAADLDIDLKQSWFLGDILDDVEAGNRAGTRTILVDVGSETLWHIDANRLPDHHVTSMQEAVETILATDESTNFWKHNAAEPAAHASLNEQSSK